MHSNNLNPIQLSSLSNTELDNIQYNNWLTPKNLPSSHQEDSDLRMNEWISANEKQKRL